MSKNKHISKNKQKSTLISTKRQKLLSDESISFVYDRHGRLIHDKTCTFARNIKDEDICGVKKYNLSMIQCPECELKAYLRYGAEDRKKYSDYAWFFSRTKTAPNQLREMYIDQGMKTYLVTRDRLHVHYRDDSWLIHALDERGNIRLMHNNYYAAQDGTRIFTGGFHEQFLGNGHHKISQALKKIENYRYIDHVLKNEEIPDIYYEPVLFSAEEKNEKISLLTGIMEWINKLLKVFRGK